MGRCAMSDTRIREPFPYFRACVVMLAGLVVVGGLEAGKALRRMVAKLKEASR